MLYQVRTCYVMLGQVKSFKATFDEDGSGSDMLVQVMPG
jgi:hypothetical protein